MKGRNFHLFILFISCSDLQYCINSLHFKVGDKVDKTIFEINNNQNSTFFFHRGPKTLLGFGTLDNDTLFMKATSLSWDKNDVIYEMKYSIVNSKNQYNVDQIEAYFHPLLMQYFGCISGFDIFLKKGGTMHFENLQFEIIKDELVY